MATLSDLVRRHTDLGPADLAWLQRLQADWQIIADLSFAEWVWGWPDGDGWGFWAAAQMRPTTGPTAYVDDVVGTFTPTAEAALLDLAWREGRLVREGDPEWRDDVPVRVEAIPVRRAGRVLAVVARNTNLNGVRTPSRLELAYLQTAAELSQMIAQGHFPAPGERGHHADTPRVGDGFVRLDERGTVGYASPNAQSVFRRLGLSGDLTGVALADLVRELVPPRRRPDEETLSAVLGGRAHRDVELDTDAVTLVVRSIPLRPQGRLIGAVILLRDVTDLRRRDRELVTKDATIREIHHRVKNNLQTVAALLRLQARRIDGAEARAALEEAVRRVGSIAVVHETLSLASEELVDFDEIAARLAASVVDVGALGGPVRVRHEGRFGDLRPEVATPLAMVLTELVQNALEHAFAPSDHAGAAPDQAGAAPDQAGAAPDQAGAAQEQAGGVGTVVVAAARDAARLTMRVSDDGRGLPTGFDLAAANLGLSIARTLVEAELGGQLEIGPRPEGRGTAVVIALPLR